MNEFNLNERKKMEQVFCVNALIFFHFFLFFIFQSEAINANRTKKKMWKPLFYHHFDFFNLTLSNLLLLKKNRVKRRVLAFASINVLYVSWNPPNNLKFISLSFARWFFSYKFFIGFSEPISWFQFKSFPKQPYTSSHFSLRIISLLFFFRLLKRKCTCQARIARVNIYYDSATMFFYSYWFPFVFSLSPVYETSSGV